MGYVELPKELETGVFDMDAQHEEIFGQMHQLKALLMGRDEMDALSFAHLTQLAIDMAMHFAWEEQAAAESGIPFADHTREHERIKKFLLAKAREFEEGECNIPALLVYMDRKFESHVAYFDQPLGRRLKETGRERPTPAAFPGLAPSGYAPAPSPV